MRGGVVGGELEDAAVHALLDLFVLGRVRIRGTGVKVGVDEALWLRAKRVGRVVQKQARK